LKLGFFSTPTSGNSELNYYSTFVGLPEQGSPPVVPMPTERHMEEGEEGEEEEGGGRTRRGQRKEGDKRKRRLKVIVNR
jgi:hypothetical protein